MNPPQNKAERLAATEEYLLAHPEGVRQADVARHFGVARSTITRDMPALSQMYPLVEHDDGRLSLDRTRYLSRLKITLNEAMSIYLGARLMYRHADLHDPHVVTTVRKLSDAIYGIAPALAGDIAATARHMEEEPARLAPGYLRALETLTTALAERRWLEVKYQALHSERPTDARFAPYILEPYGPGFATYALGLRDPPGRVFTLKVERIVSATLTDDTYEVPAEHSHAGLLEYAWGIWRPSEEGPIEVVLRFSPAVARRVRETRWHPSERVTEETDGSVTWRATVGETIEMSPWIRGWGREVEVLEPPELRASIAAELRDAAAKYR